MNSLLGMPSIALTHFILLLVLVFNDKKPPIIDNLCILLLIGLLNSIVNGFKIRKYLNSLAFYPPFKPLLFNFGNLWCKRLKKTIAIRLLRNYLWLESFRFAQKFLPQKMFITTIKNLINF